MRRSVEECRQTDYKGWGMEPPSPARVVPITHTTPAQREAAAHLLHTAFPEAEFAWPTRAAARAEVETFLGEGRRAFIALIDDNVTGWIGAIIVSPWLWELHPLVVDPAHQGHGIGTALVQRLETAARVAGVTTLYLGTDDDWGGTNLHGRDLYPGVLAAAREIAPTARHPYRFYEKLGYTVTGVIPDASGFGKPDILMAKRLA